MSKFSLIQYAMLYLGKTDAKLKNYLFKILRGAFMSGKESQKMFERALKSGYLKEILT